MLTLGDGRPVMLAEPEGMQPGAPLPCLYVLDAEGMFATVVEGLRRAGGRSSATGVRPALVVGIGAGSAGRTADFTSDAPAFLDRIEGELFPLIPQHGPRFLFGHSLAGFFVLRCLLTRSHLFEGYVAASPSIWSDPAFLLERIARLGPALAGRAVRVMTAVGTWEQDLLPWQVRAPDGAAMAGRRAERRMVDRARQFADALRALALPGLILRHEELAGEDHASIVPVAIAHGLRFLMAPPDVLSHWPEPSARPPHDSRT